jgi:hypothetical protein
VLAEKRLLGIQTSAGGESLPRFLTVNFQHGDLVRLIVSLRDVVEVHGAVESDEADLSACIARQIVQLIEDRLAGDVEVAALLGQRRHVQQEEINGWLGRPQHVLRWRNEFDRAGTNFGSSRWIAVGFTHGIVLELLGDCRRKERIVKSPFESSFQLTFVDSITQIALPFLAIYEENEGIDVGSTHAAPDDGRAADHRQVLQDKHVS